MRQTTLTTPDIGFIAATRVVLGIGIGLLVSGGLNRDLRKAVGLGLLGAGAVTTIPILLRVFRKQCDEVTPIVLVA